MATKFQNRLVPIVALAAIVGLIESAAAQVYPSRPITMIVPFPAGGGTDILARTLADHIGVSLGQPIIVENIAGASGSIGVARAVRAAPDGYTLVFGQWASHVGASAMFPVQYDVVKDLRPVARIADTPLWIVVRKTLPANDLQGLIAWLKANPGKASAATVGAGSGAHLGGVYFQNTTGTRFEYVPYRGGAPAIQDMIAGHVDFMFDQAATSLPQVRAGNIKAIAVMAKSRWFAAPNIPTVDESGVTGLHISFWHGLWVPMGTPKDLIAKLNSAVVAAFADPVVQQRFADQGQEIPPADQQTPEALAAYHKSEIEKWWPIIKAANIEAK
jgi:tripartite-type tricarboxylate transporter receptor subunit TctC